MSSFGKGLQLASAKASASKQRPWAQEADRVAGEQAAQAVPDDKPKPIVIQPRKLILLGRQGPEEKAQPITIVPKKAQPLNAERRVRDVRSPIRRVMG